MEAPAQVRRAVALLWISLGLGAVEMFTTIGTLDTEESQWRLTIIVISVAVLLLAGALIYLISRRRNWARIAYLILTVIGIVGYVSFPLTLEPWWSVALSVSVTICDVVALYWLFSGNGARWYSSMAPA